MKHLFEQHLTEVNNHFAANDLDLGYRRLLDCAIETRDKFIFKDALEFCNLFEMEKENPTLISQKAGELLEKMSAVELRAPERKNEELLSLTNVCKSYTTGNFGLKDINLSLKPGEVFGLVGENGNGKTTLMRLIAKELKPDRGVITYNLGVDPSDDYKLKNQLVYIEQRIPRWYGTLMDNLQFTLSCYKVYGEENYLWAEIMLARLGLRQFRDLKWAQISSGYKTRFELAKTLLRRPQVMLLDEPLANLDIMSQQTILQDLKFMSRSITAPFGMMLSSQHIYEVEKVSEKIIFLKDGKPQYQESNQQTGDEKFIIELELLKGSRSELMELLNPLAPESISFNGGVYLLTFPPGQSTADVLSVLNSENIEIGYYRNISHSSRRFFIN